MNHIQRSVTTAFLIFLSLIGGSTGASGQSERERQVTAGPKWEKVYVGDDGGPFKSVYSISLPRERKPLRWLWLGDEKGFVRFTVIDPDSSATLQPTKNSAFFALSKLEVREPDGKDTDPSWPINSILFLDQDHGYLLKGNKIFRTDNGGFNWSLMYHAPNRPDKSMATLQSIVLMPSKRACVVGMYSLGDTVTNSLVLCTDKALGSDGVQWQVTTVPSETQLWHASFFDNKHGWIVGAEGTLLKSDEGGKSWTLAPEQAQSLMHSYFVDEQHGWIVGRAATVLRTTDSGDHWDPVMLDFASKISGINLRSIKFAPDNLHGWIAGEQGTILSTEDGGLTWELQQPPQNKDKGGVDSNVLLALFVDDTFCWAVGGTLPLRPGEQSQKNEGKNVIWRYRWK